MCIDIVHLVVCMERQQATCALIRPVQTINFLLPAALIFQRCLNINVGTSIQDTMLGSEDLEERGKTP